MKLEHYTKIPLEEVTMEGAKKAKIRWLISDKDDPPNFVMRMFEVEPGGFTPFHAHEWEHENFILEGSGVLVTKDDELPFKKGDVIYVDPFMEHNYKNTGKETLRFLCLIPLEKTNKEKKIKQNVNPFASGKANNC
ncbi:MAG: cupin domain-containing protein [Candidatus Cloacimonetes bacterium]|nr:cupin domain-containing protein [Candidatus Cloacimonadota bacterium]